MNAPPNKPLLPGLRHTGCSMHTNHLDRPPDTFKKLRRIDVRTELTFQSHPWFSYLGRDAAIDLTVFHGTSYIKVTSCLLAFFRRVAAFFRCPIHETPVGIEPTADCDVTADADCTCDFCHGWRAAYALQTAGSSCSDLAQPDLTAACEFSIGRVARYANPNNA